MNKKEIAFWVVLIAILIFTIYVAKLMLTESGQCLKNPFTYGANMVQADLISCSCLVTDEQKFTSFSFNKTNMQDTSSTFK